MRVLAMRTAWSPQPFVTWPLGMLPPNENEREVDQVTGITVQKEEEIGATGRAISTEEDETVTGVIH